MERIAVYAGSFDPITNGHMDLVKRAARLFDRVVLAIGSNPAKRYLLSMEERKAVLSQCTSELPNVTVDTFEGLLVDYCREVDANVILRGLRAVTDFEFEFQISDFLFSSLQFLRRIDFELETKEFKISRTLKRQWAVHCTWVCFNISTFNVCFILQRNDRPEMHYCLACCTIRLVKAPDIFFHLLFKLCSSSCRLLTKI